MAKQNPERPESWRNLGGAYASYGMYEDAHNYFEKAYQLAPTNSEVVTQLGFVNLALERSEKAFYFFQKAILYAKNENDTNAVAELENFYGKITNMITFSHLFKPK